MKTVAHPDPVDIFGKPIDWVKNSQCAYKNPTSALATFAQKPGYLMTYEAFATAYMTDERRKKKERLNGRDQAAGPDCTD